jgi:4-amino-4-deoxy-L-arabinose transferase-like glycosyltransferase
MPRRHYLIALLCLAWILPGLVAHDPWKPDEAYTFGVVYDLLQGRDWIVPMLAGEPFLDEPPLYYYLSAFTALAFSPLLPLHDAARLATGLCMIVAFIFCGLAGRELNDRPEGTGPGTGTLAVILLLGCFGLVVRGHQLITDIAAFAGFAIAYYGYALAARRVSGGVWAGLGVGVVFLSQGLLEFGVLVIIGVLLPVISPAWRSRTYAKAAGLALIAALPWLLVWPLALRWHAPELFEVWLRGDTIAHLWETGASPIYYLRILPWYAWPVWALALWTLWRARANPGFTPAVILPLTGFAVTLLALTAAGDKRELYALPLLLPLTLLAAPAVTTVRRGAANAWYWFSVMGFTFFIFVAWFYWSGLELGVPARLHAHLHRIQPGYTPGFKWLPFLLGLVYTAGWFVVLLRLKRSPERPAVIWATGVTVVWGMLAILFIGWVDTGKSYRSMMLSLRSAMPAQYRCVGSRDLGDTQRAMLRYFAGIETFREEVATRRRDCDIVLVQGRAQEEHIPLGGWEKIWEGNRPGDKDERFRLYQHSKIPAKKR